MPLLLLILPLSEPISTTFSQTVFRFECCLQKQRNLLTRQAPAEMVEPSSAEYVELGERSSPKLDKYQKVSIIPLVFLIFYEVSGGPFGVEDSVQAAGPLLALLGFLLIPFILSIPEALITAELGTMFPENGGYVVWVSSALGPYWGFQQGWRSEERRVGKEC